MATRFVRMESYQGTPMSLLFKQKGKTLSLYVNIPNLNGEHRFSESTTEYDDVFDAIDALERMTRVFEPTKVAVVSRRVIV